MLNDPIVEEIHRIRDEYAASFNYDFDATVRDLQEKEKKLKKKPVKRAPKFISDDKVA